MIWRMECIEYGGKEGMELREWSDLRCNIGCCSYIGMLRYTLLTLHGFGLSKLAIVYEYGYWEGVHGGKYSIGF